MQDKKQEKRISIKSILTTGKEHEPCTLTGWVRTKRLSKNCGFIEINDGSSQKSLQLTIPMESEAFQVLKAINTGASIEARGTLVPSLGKGQALELQTDTITIIGDADPQSYPLQKKGHTLEFLREIAHLRPRTNTFGAMFRVRNQLSYSVHQFFQERGFVWAHTPILTASDCEGAGELFHVTTLDLKNVPKTEKHICFSYITFITAT